MSADTIRLAEPRFDRNGDSNYHPCDTGLHLCGIAARPGDDYEQPYTALNLPASSAEQALAMFNAAKAAAECSKEQQDFICDLVIGGDTERDFNVSRQMVSRLIASAIEARSDATGTGAAEGESAAPQEDARG